MDIVLIKAIIGLLVVLLLGVKFGFKRTFMAWTLLCMGILAMESFSAKPIKLEIREGRAILAH